MPTLHVTPKLLNSLLLSRPLLCRKGVNFNFRHIRPAFADGDGYFPTTFLSKLVAALPAHLPHGKMNCAGRPLGPLRLGGAHANTDIHRVAAGPEGTYLPAEAAGLLHAHAEY